MVKNEKSRVEQTMNRGMKLLWENTLSYKRSIDKHNFAVYWEPLWNGMIVKGKGNGLELTSGR